MAFKNLPIITTKIIDAGLPAAEIFSKPIALGLGWLEDDYFAGNKEPVFFNTPYYISGAEGVNTLLPNGGEALEAALMIASGANKSNPNSEVVPVVVRIGYPDFKVSDGTNESTDESGSLTSGPVTVSWDSHSWDANVKVTVVKTSEGKMSVYYNGENGYPVVEDVDSTTEVNLEWLGATLKVTGDWDAASAGTVAEFTFTARKKPENNEEKYKALIDALKEIDGLEVAYVTLANANLDDKITANSTSVWENDPDYADDLSTVKLNFGYALARFAHKVSTSYHSCFALLGVNKPDAIGPTNLKDWVDKLNDLEGWKDGFYATATGRLGDTAVVDEKNMPVDIGKHLIVVAFHGTLTGYSSTNLGPFIGAWLANRPTEVPGTFINIQFDLSELGISDVEQYLLMFNNYNVIDQLYGARINIPVPIYNAAGQVIAFKIPIARTGAMPSSSFTKLSTMKIATQLMQDLRDAANAFLGRPLNGLIFEVMRSELQKVVDGYRNAGYFAAGKVSVEAGNINTVLGEVKVNVEVQMYAEITTINITGVFSIAGV